MTLLWTVVIITIIVALLFDIVNGFHDAANSIATVVSTRVLSPRFAVLWAAFFNFAAMFVFNMHVAGTIKGIVKIDATDPAFVYVVLAGLLGAIIWDLLTWYWGLPTSSSHALIGGLAGAGLTHAGYKVINWEKIEITALYIPLAPLIGFAMAFIIMIVVFWIFRRWRPQSIDRLFRKMQLVSAALYSLGHGGNDAQKTMGVIMALLMAAGVTAYDRKTFEWYEPDFLWIVLSCHLAMAIGTALGGWRIVKTMGMKITKLKPVGGFCAETAGAMTLWMATQLGIPVSTTHTITGSIIGVGATSKLSGIKWGVAKRIVWAWILTMPLSALMAALAFLVIKLIHPVF